MRVISNDTNIWLEFNAISRINLPFRLPYIYTIYKEAFEQSDNLSTVKDDLLSNGLILDDVSTEEFFYALELRNRYAKLTRYDCITLAIAKLQNIPILTDDKFVKQASYQEAVPVLTTLDILNQLLYNHYISEVECDFCLKHIILPKKKNTMLNVLQAKSTVIKP